MGTGRFSRKIVGLEYATRLDARPKTIPRPRRGAGAKGLGLAYERALAAKLKPFGFEHGVWFEFVDANGHGYCSPDLILIQRSRVVVIEAKLTDGIAGRHQLENLYRPVLEKTFDLPVQPILALRHMTHEAASEPYTSIENLLSLVPAHGLAVLHWLGRGPL